jgi:hypothetical protein
VGFEPTPAFADQNTHFMIKSYVSNLSLAP